METRAWTYGLTANIVVLGVVSLLTDVSSEMILPILPFFLISVLSANAFIVGLVEGLADSVVAFMKVVSGRWSDVAGSRRGFVAAGYGLSTAMKVLFPFAQVWTQFLGMRIAERMGKGVRDAPRDALLTESTPAETREGVRIPPGDGHHGGRRRPDPRPRPPRDPPPLHGRGVRVSAHHPDRGGARGRLVCGRVPRARANARAEPDPSIPREPAEHPAPPRRLHRDRERLLVRGLLLRLPLAPRCGRRMEHVPRDRAV